MKQKLLKLILMTTICATMIATTGCGSIKEMISPKDSDTKVEEDRDKDKERDEEDENEVEGYTSSRKVINAFWEAMEDQDRDLMTTCFYEKATTAEDAIDDNMEAAEKTGDYTTYYLDDLEIEENEEDAEDIVEDFNYKRYDDVAHYTVTVPMTQVIENVEYEVEDIYDIVTVCYDDNWYIVKIEEIDVVIIDSTDLSVDSNEDIEDDEKKDSDEDTTEDSSNETEDDLDTSDISVAEDFSSTYADKDNRSFMINGKMYTVGVTTLQELIDDGVVFEDLSNANNNIKSDHESENFTILLNEDEYYDCNVRVGNFTDDNMTIANCPIISIYLYPEQDVKFVENTVNFAFPLNMTEEELRNNSGEPTDYSEYISDTSDYESHILYYEWENTKYLGSSGYTFEFVNGELYHTCIEYMP